MHPGGSTSVPVENPWFKHGSILGFGLTLSLRALISPLPEDAPLPTSPTSLSPKPQDHVTDCLSKNPSWEPNTHPHPKLPPAVSLLRKRPFPALGDPHPSPRHCVSFPLFSMPHIQSVPSLSLALKSTHFFSFCFLFQHIIISHSASPKGLQTCLLSLPPAAFLPSTPFPTQGQGWSL